MSSLSAMIQQQLFTVSTLARAVEAVPAQDFQHLCATLTEDRRHWGLLLVPHKDFPDRLRYPQHKICNEDISVGGIELEQGSSLRSIPPEEFPESVTWVRTQLVEGMFAVSFELPLQHLDNVAVRLRWVYVSVGFEVALFASILRERNFGRSV